MRVVVSGFVEDDDQEAVLLKCGILDQRIDVGLEPGIRDIKEAIDKLEKDKKISQDEQKRALDELEKIAHAETKKIEDLSAAKEKEILEIR